MIIVPTRVCNSNQCDYCSVLKEDQGKLYFKEGFQIEDFIERLVYLRTITGENEIRFFGGEPFLALSRIEEIVRRTTPLGFRTVINTNLSLFKKEHIEFLRQYQIKLIVSCNGDLLSHCPTRWVSAPVAMKLYKDISTLVSEGIDYQINIVVQNETVDRLVKNLTFIRSLGARQINLLPVSYVGWSTKSLVSFRVGLAEVALQIEKWELDIYFENLEMANAVNLFVSEIVIDSDGGVYPSMVVLETFFREEKSDILMSDFSRGMEIFQKDLAHWSGDLHEIYSAFITKTLRAKFGDLLDHDNEASHIFADFLENIRSVSHRS